MIETLIFLLLQASGPSPHATADPAESARARPERWHSTPVLKAGAMTADDYPRESLANEETGSVYVSYVVTTAGHAHDCRVERSSGHPALDAATCRIVNQRYLLEPARDGDGKAIEIRAKQWVSWQLPG